jgi:hypothetical protein
MTYAFAKDSRACAVCQSWAGARELSPDMTLAYVPRYSAEGECRTAVSQDYGRVTKSYHTCECWSAMLMLRAHGARHSRTPGPSAAMEGLLAATPGDKRPAVPLPAPPAPAAAPVPPVSPAAARAAHPLPAPAPPPPAPPVELCDSTLLDFDKIPPTALVLLNYWRRLKGDRAMPAATEINTAALRDTLTKLSLFAPAADGQGFEYRACGRAVRRRLEVRPAGRQLTECHDADSAARLTADLRACLTDGAARAVLVRGDKLLPGQKFVELFLPLSDSRGAPALVLAWRNVPGG